MMNLNDLKAEFGHAYVRAVAHAAGFFVQEANRAFDNAGVDLTVLRRSSEGIMSSPRLDLQLKTTAGPLTKDPFPFDLGLKNYNELRVRAESLQVPRILVVVVVPQEVAAWVSATEDALLLRHCAYWKSLRGAAATENEAAVRVHISRADLFHVPQVQSIMDRIQNGGQP